MTSPLRDAESATAGVPVVAYRHEITEPGKDVMIMYSGRPDNPWSHWMAEYLGQCVYECMALVLASELDTAMAEIDRLREALAKIERWELPRTGRVWNDNAPPSPENDMSYGALYGSNGERDFMRQVARDALTTEPASPSALTAAQARIAELEGALKPFAAIGQYLIDQGFTTKPDNGDMWGFDGISVTYGDFRTAARATLSPVKENDRG